MGFQTNFQRYHDVSSLISLLIQKFNWNPAGPAIFAYDREQGCYGEQGCYREQGCFGDTGAHGPFGETSALALWLHLTL